MLQQQRNLKIAWLLSPTLCAYVIKHKAHTPEIFLRNDTTLAVI